MQGKVWTTVGVVASSLVLALGAGLGGAAAAVSFPSAHARPVAKAHPAAKTVNVVTKILTGSMDHKGGPEFSPGNFRLPAHALVHMTVISYDDGPAPAPGYTAIRGVVGGKIWVDGKAVTQVNPKDITHTFTVPALGLNVPIPAAPKGGKVTVSFTFRTQGPGSYLWQCYALCGNGNGWGYPMTTMGMMRGTVKVVG
jgi:hypothetical protein